MTAAPSSCGMRRWRPIIRAMCGAITPTKESGPTIMGVTALVGTAMTSSRRNRLKVRPTPTARLEASPSGR